MDQPQPLDPSQTAAHADLLIERRRLGEARSLLARALKEHPDHVELRYRAAFVDYLADDHDDALVATRQLLTNAPEHYGARTLLAHLLEETQQLPAAEQIWIELIRDYPEDADTFAAYARLMLRTLHIDKARKLAAEALRFEPEHNQALFTTAIADLIEGKRGARSEHLEALVREHPEHVSTAMALIVALQDRGDSRGALRISQELLRSNPTDPHILEMTRELKRNNHWSLLPLYPMQRWGWGGAAAVWLLGVVGLRALEGHVSPTTQIVAAAVWLLYVIYSWVWPPILKRLI